MGLPQLPSAHSQQARVGLWVFQGLGQQRELLEERDYELCDLHEIWHSCINSQVHI